MWLAAWRRMAVLLSLSRGPSSVCERRRLGVLQKYQSRAWRGLEPLQEGLQPERQCIYSEVAGQRASAACCVRCD